MQRIWQVTRLGCHQAAGEGGSGQAGRAGRTWHAGSTPCGGCGRRQRSAACGRRSARPSPEAAPGAPWRNLQECGWLSRGPGRGHRPSTRLNHTANTGPPLCQGRRDTKHSQNFGPHGNGPAGCCLSSSPLYPQYQRLRQGQGCPVTQSCWSSGAVMPGHPRARVKGGPAGKGRAEGADFEVLQGEPSSPASQRPPTPPPGSQLSLQAGLVESLPRTELSV